MENMKKFKTVALPVVAIGAGFAAIFTGALALVNSMEKFVIAFYAVANNNGYQD